MYLRVVHHLKKRIEFRPLNDQGFNEMGSKLKSFDWNQVLNLESADNQMESFQNNLFLMFSESFPMKTKIVFNESQEFFTDKLVILRRKKQTEYNKHRRSEKYESLHQTYKKELSKAKSDYYKKKIQIMRTSSPNMWHRALKRVMTGDGQEDVIEGEAIKDLPNEEQVELIANKFAEVANMYEPLDRTKISVPPFSESDISIVRSEGDYGKYEYQQILQKNRYPCQSLQNFC